MSLDPTGPAPLAEGSCSTPASPWRRACAPPPSPFVAHHIPKRPQRPRPRSEIFLAYDSSITLPLGRQYSLPGFPDNVLRQPARFGVSASEARAVAARLRGELDTLLAARAITYVRSDGAQQRVTLAELVARKAAFEVAYNPNDCVETRWGAPAGSAEAQSCQRRAPPEQVQRMARYREWFARRQRPAR